MNATQYIYTLKTTIKQKNPKKTLPFENGGQITDFASCHFDFGENLKHHFRKRIVSVKFGS